MCTINVAETGKRIALLREREGMTIREFADLLHVSVQTVYHWQSGISVPSIDTLVIISDLFGVPIDALLAREGDSSVRIRNGRIA